MDGDIGRFGVQRLCALVWLSANLVSNLFEAKSIYLTYLDINEWSLSSHAI